MEAGLARLARHPGNYCAFIWDKRAGLVGKKEASLAYRDENFFI